MKEHPPGPMELAETLAEVARGLLSEPDLDRTLERIVDMAVKTVPGCECAGISLVERRSITTRAASGDVPHAVDAIQHETNSGPCLDAIQRHEVFVTDDLRAEARWPEFSERVTEATGVRSVMSVRLFAEDDTMGALTLCSTSPSAFDEESTAVAAVFAAHASVAISASRREENLEKALASRDLIGQAKGILMAQQLMSADEAFDALRSASQHLNLKLRDVADRVILTGEIPTRTEQH